MTDERGYCVCLFVKMKVSCITNNQTRLPQHNSSSCISVYGVSAISDAKRIS